MDIFKEVFEVEEFPYCKTKDSLESVLSKFLTVSVGIAPWFNHFKATSSLILTWHSPTGE